MRRLLTASALTVTIALASCVSAPKPAPAPAPRPTPVYVPPPPPAPLASDWRDWPLTPGDWVYRQDARGSIALFGATNEDAVVTLRCDRGAGQMYLSRRDTGMGPGSVTIRTTSTQRAITLQPTGGTPAYLAAALTPRDSLLDAMAFSRGRFTIEQAGQPPLVIPAYAEIGRVIEDCRG